MVELMNNDEAVAATAAYRGKKAAVKAETDDPLEAHAPLRKRSKSSTHGQQSKGIIGGSYSGLVQLQYNPLEEPSPLGLQLRKSPSLLDLIQMTLSQKSSSKTSKKDNKGATYSNGMEKLKASNFPASVLRIGTWEYKSRYEGDLVAKCYFAKHKLVWEVLDGGLKNKIEIQWSDIMAIKAIYHDDAPGSLSIVLARPPLFYRETNPQPRKHTLWQATSDFTNGQATIHRRHYMHCPQGLLGKHYEKLIQCDPRLNFLSQQPEITLENPYFEPKVAVYNNPSETSHSFEVKSPAALNYINSPSGIQSSTETLSPSSEDQCKDLEDWNNMIVPGLPNSMSMNDLVNHFEQRISESSSNIILSSEERQSLDVLEDIRRYLFSDATPESDEKRLMARVDSLCCLLQADPVKVENDVVIGKSGETKVDPTICERKEVEKSESGVENKESLSMSRKDSVGDLLMNLPPIASLPSDYAHW